MSRTVLYERKNIRMKVESLIEEILAEIETGKSGRPILDAIVEKNGESFPIEETAGEQQREPTTPASKKGAKKR